MVSRIFPPPDGRGSPRARSPAANFSLCGCSLLASAAFCAGGWRFGLQARLLVESGDLGEDLLAVLGAFFLADAVDFEQAFFVRTGGGGPGCAAWRRRRR